MARHLAFVDTNVFLHCRFFDELDWRECVSGEDVVLTICPAVLAELDKKKFTDPSRRVRDRARGVVRRIGELVTDDQPVQFRKGCSLWVTSRSPLMDLAAWGLSKDVIDDVILASAIEQRDKGENVTLVSTDIGIRLKGNTHHLRTFPVPEDWLLPDEVDEQERELRALRKQAAETAAASPNLRLTFGGSSVKEFVVKPSEPMPTEIIKKRLDGMRRLKKYQALQVPAASAYEIAGALGEPSRRQIIEYNNGVKTFFAQFEEYLHNSHEIFEARARTLTLDITMENNGQESAEDVDVVLTADADGIWHDELPSGKVAAPKPPEMPRSMPYAVMSQMPDIQPIFREPRENAIALPINYGKYSEARFHVNRVKPRFPESLPTRYFELASFDDARSFKLSYELFGRNLRVPQSGELHIKVLR